MTRQVRTGEGQCFLVNFVWWSAVPTMTQVRTGRRSMLPCELCLMVSCALNDKCERTRVNTSLRTLAVSCALNDTTLSILPCELCLAVSCALNDTTVNASLWTLFDGQLCPKWHNTVNASLRTLFGGQLCPKWHDTQCFLGNFVWRSAVP